MIATLKQEYAKNHCKICNGKGEVNDIPPSLYDKYPRVGKKREIQFFKENLRPCPCLRRMVNNDFDREFYKERTNDTLRS